MRDGVLPRWQDDLTQRTGDPGRWNPQAALPSPLDGLHTVYQGADDQVLEEIYSDDERPLEVSAEEALHIEHGEAWVSVPNERITHLSHRGRRVRGQVAVFDGIDQNERTEPVIFTDLRGLALFPQWTQNHGTVFKLLEYHETLDMPELPGWTLLVQGGQPRDDGVNIDVQTGELLSFALVKDDSTSEDDVDMDPDSEDSTGGESDDGAEDGARFLHRQPGSY